MFETRYKDIVLHKISKISKIHIDKLRIILKNYKFSYNVKVIQLFTLDELVENLSINENIKEVEVCTTNIEHPYFYKTVFQEYNNKSLRIDIIKGRVTPAIIYECGEVSKPKIDKVETTIFIKSITILDKNLNEKTIQNVYIYTP